MVSDAVLGGGMPVDHAGAIPAGRTRSPLIRSSDPIEQAGEYRPRPRRRPELERSLPCVA